MYNDSKINKLILKSAYITIIVLIIAVIALIILKYNIEGEKNMPFKLSNIIVISTAEGANQKENKRVAMKLDTVYIMKHVEIPISIVECGFLSNPEEEQQLLNDEYQDKLAWGIFNVIIDYFNE